MNKQWYLTALFLITQASLFAQGLNVLTAKEKAEGWQLLFDGKTLNGWHSSVPPARAARGPADPSQAKAVQKAAPQPTAHPSTGTPQPCVTPQGRGQLPAGASHWEVVDGVVSGCGEPAGYLTSDRTYANFALSIEFKCPADANSGVFVRAPEENNGYEVNIWTYQPEGYNTGAINGTGKTARDFLFKPDQWNRFEITANGDHLVVVLNGETTLDVHDSKFASGNIRLQYQMFPIQFRSIKLRPI